MRSAIAVVIAVCLVAANAKYVNVPSWLYRHPQARDLYPMEDTVPYYRSGLGPGYVNRGPGEVAAASGLTDDDDLSAPIPYEVRQRSLGRPLSRRVRSAVVNDILFNDERVNTKIPISNIHQLRQAPKGIVSSSTLAGFSGGVSEGGGAGTTKTGNGVTEETTKTDAARAEFLRHHDAYGRPAQNPSTMGDVYFVAIVAGCSAIALVLILSSGYCYYKVHKRAREAADVDYPAYGVTGPNTKDSGSPTADRKLAQSAQMYHFQHQKQQMIAVEKNQSARRASGGSDVDTEDEHEEGDYTVYECPGLAPTGAMEVKNPLFGDEPTPISPQDRTVRKP